MIDISPVFIGEWSETMLSMSGITVFFFVCLFFFCSLFIVHHVLQGSNGTMSVEDTYEGEVKKI